MALLQTPGMALSQRGKNGQVSGRLIGMGTVPLMVCSFLPRPTPWQGIDFRRFTVYGCKGLENNSLTGAASTIRP